MNVSASSGPSGYQVSCGEVVMQQYCEMDISKCILPCKW